MLPPEPPVLFDTHALLWHLEDSPDLPPTVRSLFTEVEEGRRRGLVPTIVLAELLALLEKKQAPVPFAAILEGLRETGRFDTPPLDLAVVCAMADLPGTNLRDRAILATARLFGAVLVTKDRALRRPGLVPTLWE